MQNQTHILRLVKKIVKKILNLKLGGVVRISKYKNIFAKGYTPNWSEEVFVTKKDKNIVPWTCVINGLNGEEILERFTKNELQKSKSRRILN